MLVEDICLTEVTVTHQKILNPEWSLRHIPSVHMDIPVSSLFILFNNPVKTFASLNFYQHIYVNRSQMLVL